MTCGQFVRIPGRWLLALVAGMALAFPACAKAPPPESGRTADKILVLTKAPERHFSLGSDYGNPYGGGPSYAAERRMAKRLARHYGLALVDDWPMPLLGLDCFVMAVPAGETPDHVVSILSADPLVTFAEPMHEFRGEGAPPVYNDPLYPAEPAARVWRLADLHQLSTGRNVTIAMIDSGVDTSHPDLAGQIALNRNFVTGRAAVAENHGTGIAGVIAAKPDNGVGIVGVAPQARVLALRACWQTPDPAQTICDSLSLAKALHFAIDSNAQVINLSLAGPRDELLSRLLDVAAVRGMTIVAAYDAALAGGGFPATHPGVVRVADETLAGRTSGVYIAPGRDVLTTQPGGRWYLVNGSSYAAAHVSGLFALLRSGRPAGGRAPVLLSAGGMIDACASLLRVRGPCDCACANPDRSPARARR